MSTKKYIIGVKYPIRSSYDYVKVAKDDLVNNSQEVCVEIHMPLGDDVITLARRNEILISISKYLLSYKGNTFVIVTQKGAAKIDATNISILRGALSKKVLYLPIATKMGLYGKFNNYVGNAANINCLKKLLQYKAEKTIYVKEFDTYDGTYETITDSSDREGHAKDVTYIQYYGPVARPIGWVNVDRIKINDTTKEILVHLADKKPFMSMPSAKAKEEKAFAKAKARSDVEELLDDKINMWVYNMFIKSEVVPQEWDYYDLVVCIAYYKQTLRNPQFDILPEYITEDDLDMLGVISGNRRMWEYVATTEQVLYKPERYFEDSSADDDDDDSEE